jgi:hypothetical protein
MERAPKPAKTVGESIIQGLMEAIAWTQGEPIPVRITTAQCPVVDGKVTDQTKGATNPELHA